MKIYRDIFDRIISPENLFSAWDEFRSDKTGKRDVRLFEWNLEQNIFELHRESKNGTYTHRPYSGFWISDPKPRHIHKAAVRDRIVHHAVFSVLNPIFEATFLPTSFSCRVGYGTHKGVEWLQETMRKVSGNGTKPCYVLKCDVRKFFDSVDHEILLSILGKKIKDAKVMALLRTIVGSYRTSLDFERGRGIPIGNLTSQLFANVYLGEFDQFMKHKLKVKHYARYTDDFFVVSTDRAYLENLLLPIADFLKSALLLELHPNKSILRPICQGMDFLGYVVFPKYRLLRTQTKRRLMRKLESRRKDFETGVISRPTFEASLNSYLGVLSHANAYCFRGDILNRFWIT